MSRSKRTSLLIADRCDRCPAQAFVAVEIHGSELLFCGHHYRKNEIGLVAAGAAVILDSRDSINEKPSVSANV